MADGQNGSSGWQCPVALKPEYVAMLLSLGDDALVLGHRLSEWCGHGPFLEEDIALTNMALDHVGRANSLLALAGEVENEGRSEDDLAFLRDATEFRNVALAELPRGDFAFTIVRQFLMDAFSLPFYAELSRSAEGRLAGIALKVEKEATYHLRHSATWVRRLGGGTDESHRRAQNALDDAWMYSAELFDYEEHFPGLIAAGVLPSSRVVQSEWQSVVTETLAAANLEPPETKYFFTGARTGRHTEHLGHLLSEMQILARSHPGASW